MRIIQQATLSGNGANARQVGPSPSHRYVTMSTSRPASWTVNWRAKHPRCTSSALAPCKCDL